MTRALLLLLLLLTAPVLAADVYVGTITSSGASVNNAAATVPFGLMSPRRYAVQCDAGAFVVAGDVATAETGVLVAAGQLYDVWLPSPVIRIAIISQGGTATCRVFRYSPPPSGH